RAWAGSTTINAQQNSQLFDISDLKGRPVTLDGLTLTGGYAGSGNGGAIQAHVLPLTIQNSTISGNVAGGRGGAISSTGAVTVTNSTISGNICAINGGRGGGIYAQGV